MFRIVFLPLFLSSLLAAPALCALFTDPSELPSGKSYDYVVIGAGNAGGVVASRLTEDASVNVLVIEAGGDDQADDLISQYMQIPLMAFPLQNSRVDWNFTTTPQKGLFNKVLHYVRGKVLGGSSSVNFLTYTRGSADDYDRWAKVTGDNSWSWDKMKPFMSKMERLTPSTDDHDISGQIDISAHGTDGPLAVSLPNYPLLLDDMVMKATHELSDRYPFNKDLNAGNVIGIGYNQAAIKNGTRDSVATAYIRPALARGDNLDVLLNTQAIRITPTEYVDGLPSFRTVHFATGPDARVYTTTVGNEVVISCGAAMTPHLLQLSGIGAAAELKAAGIEPIVDLPDVGKNLQDHPLFSQPYVVSDPGALDRFLQNETLQSEAMEEWQYNRKGILGNSFSSQTGWLRLPDDSAVFDSTADPSAGPRSAHFAVIFTATFVSTATNRTAGDGFITVSNIVASPTSRGSISLTTSDPWVQPEIDINLLATNYDIHCMREAVKISHEFLKAPSLAGFVLGPFGELSNNMTDAELEDYIRSRTGTIHHMVGTARMSSWGSKEGVLNPDLTVKGVHGLRVIDASIFPFITSAHTMAPTYIVAERGAELLKAARYAKSQNYNQQTLLGGKSTHIGHSDFDL